MWKHWISDVFIYTIAIFKFCIWMLLGLYIFFNSGKCIFRKIFNWKTIAFVLVSAIQQHKSVIIIHIYSPSGASLPPPISPSRSPQSARLHSLCYIWTISQLHLPYNDRMLCSKLTQGTHLTSRGNSLCWVRSSYGSIRHNLVIAFPHSKPHIIWDHSEWFYKH